MFVGLDCETTGSDWLKHALIQIGVSCTSYPIDVVNETFVSDVGHDEWEENPEATKIHKFTSERIQSAPRPAVVDTELMKWLKEHANQHNNIPVGWNVGGFDMPFVRKWLPKSAEFFSYRTLDLNAICFTLTNSSGSKYKRLKEKAKKWASEVYLRHYNPGTTFHDAGYDAASSLAIWYYLRDEMKRNAYQTVIDLLREQLGFVGDDKSSPHAGRNI